MAKEVRKTISIFVNGKEVENNLKSIKAAIAKVSNELNKMTVGTDEYNAHAAKLSQLKKIYDEYKEELKDVREELEAGEKAHNNFVVRAGAMASVVNTGYSALQKFVSSTQEYVEAYASIDDAMSGVMKTTGMTREEVEALNESLKNIDTRTSQEGLLTIAQIGGRMGLAKDQILSFTEAVDKANVALGDSFSGGAEEISSVLGKISLAFKETRDGDIGESLSRIGSAINEVGGKANATEPNIAAFVQRVGSMPEAFRPSVQEAVALGAAFEESSIDAEVASRAFGILMNKASTDVEGFARVMGQPAEAVRELINSNPTQFFTEFAKSLQGMDATQIGETLKGLKLNADGVVKIVGAMSGSYDRFNEILQVSNTAFSENTSLMNEFNNVNGNSAAQLEKARKRMQELKVEIGQRLIPVITKITEMSAGTMQVAIQIGKWMVQNKGVVLAYAAAMTVLYAIRQKEVILAKKEAIQLAVEKAGVATATTFTNLFALAKARLTKNTLAAATAQKALKAAFASTPWGAIITLATTLAVTMFTMKKNTDAAVDAQRDLSSTIEQNYNEEAFEIEKLRKLIDDENVSREEKLKAINRLKEIIPEYTAELSKEGVVTDQNAQAIDDYLSRLHDKIELEATEAKLKELYNNKADKRAEYEQKRENFLNSSLWFGYRKRRKESEEAAKSYEEAAKSYDNMKDSYEELMKRQIASGNSVVTNNTNGNGNVTNTNNSGGPNTTSSSTKTDHIADFEKKLADFRKRQQNASLEGWAKTKQGIIDSYQEMIDEANHLNQTETAKGLETERDDAIKKAGQKYLRNVADMMVKFREQAESLNEGEEVSPLMKAIAGTEKEWDDKILQLKLNMETLQDIIDDMPDDDDQKNALQGNLDYMAEQYAQSTALKAAAVSNTIKKFTKDTDDFILAEQKEMDKANLTDIERQKLAIEEKYDLEIQKLQEVYDARAAKDANDPELANLQAQIKQLKEMKVRASGRARGNNIWENLLNIDWKNFKDNWRDNLQTMTAALQEFANAAFDIFNSINQIQSNRENAAFDEWCDIQDEKSATLQRQLDDGIISQKYYDAQMAKIQKEKEAKEKKIQHDQFEREKKANIIQATINGALAIVTAFAQLGPIAGAIAAVVTAATTAAQIAVMASQANPYAKGGYIKGEQLALMGEEGDEWVASNKLVTDKKTAPIIAALEAYQRGNHRALEKISLTQPDWNRLSQSAKNISTTFAGSKTPVVNNYNSNIDNSEVLKELKQMNEYLKDPKNRQAYISRRVQLEYEEQENELKAMARL